LGLTYYKDIRTEELQANSQRQLDWETSFWEITFLPSFDLFTTNGANPFRSSSKLKSLQILFMVYLKTFCIAFSKRKHF